VKQELIKWAAGAAIGLATGAVVKRLVNTRTAAVVTPLLTIVMRRLLDEPIQRRIQAMVRS
jgi:large-conductance mechanosensitive channel